MDRVLPRPVAIPWRFVAALGVVLALDIFLWVVALEPYPVMLRPQDWEIVREIVWRLPSGALYEQSDAYLWVWSPLAAYLFHPILAAGFPFWFAMHLAALVFLRDPRVIALALLFLAFWADTAMGNAMTFVAVAGFVALRGSRWGALAYLFLCVLMPRPIQAPLALWLLWRDRSLWAPFAAMVALNLGVALWTGYLDEWLLSLLPFGDSQTTNVGNLGPTRILGLAWFLVGVPLAGWLTRKGRVGLAGLALSPYVFPQYLLVLGWEVRRE